MQCDVTTYLIFNPLYGLLRIRISRTLRANNNKTAVMVAGLRNHGTSSEFDMVASSSYARFRIRGDRQSIRAVPKMCEFIHTYRQQHFAAFLLMPDAIMHQSRCGYIHTVTSYVLWNVLDTLSVLT